MKSKKYYAYFISQNKQGVCENWKECEKLVSGVKNARYQSFKSQEEAIGWLGQGAEYEKNKRIKIKLKSGIYFDAGTGRGQGVEISVTDKNGKDLLDKVLSKKKLNKYHKHLVKGVTNNYGELLACYYAIKLALKKKTLRIFGDSKLVIEYWSKGFIKRKIIPAETIKLAEKVFKLRKQYKKLGGKITHISGDDNPADLGFH